MSFSLLKGVLGGWEEVDREGLRLCLGRAMMG